MLQANARGFVAKLSDFGLSQLQPEQVALQRTGRPGAPMPASADDGWHRDTHGTRDAAAASPGSCASDVYSFGILGDVLLRSALLCLCSVALLRLSASQCLMRILLQRPFAVHAQAYCPDCEQEFRCLQQRCGHAANEERVAEL